MKGRKHAYIGVEKMCTEEEREDVEKEVLNFIQDCGYQVLDGNDSNEFTEEGRESQEIIDALEFL